MAIITTISGTDTNSYVTMAEADAYFDNSPYGSAWTSDEATLRYAAIMLDSMCAWKGVKTVIAQAREFPRMGLTVDAAVLSPAADYDSPLLGSYWDHLIPPEIKNAQIELALYMVKNPTSFVTEGTNISRISVGPIDLRQEAAKIGVVDMLPPLIQGMVAKYGKVRKSGSSLFQARTVRG